MLALEAFAKINRRLVVLGKRPDGYHELDTLFQTIDLADRLTFEAAEDGDVRLETDDPALPVDGSNLVVKAAGSLKDRFDVRRGASIHLSKRIPKGGGLGGGGTPGPPG